MYPTNPKPPLPAGLAWRHNTIFIETSILGRRARRSTGTDDVKAAQEQLEVLRGAIRMANLAGTPGPDLRPKKTLRQFVAETLDEMRADQAAKATLTRYAGVMATFATTTGQAECQHWVLGMGGHRPRRGPRSPDNQDPGPDPPAPAALGGPRDDCAPACNHWG
jgi:hypothetical protein